MSDARRATPWRSPRTSGVERRAATIVSGSSACTTAMEKAPRTRPSAARVASASDSPAAMCRSMRWAITSVSVAELMMWPPATRSARKAPWFSMIPLWTRARRPVQSRWGWAFSAVGWPCVAQRVWPMPAPWPTGGGWSVVSWDRSATERVPSAARTRQIPPSATSATPAES